MGAQFPGYQQAYNPYSTYFRRPYHPEQYYNRNYPYYPYYPNQYPAYPY